MYGALSLGQSTYGGTTPSLFCLKTEEGRGEGLCQRIRWSLQEELDWSVRALAVG